MLAHFRATDIVTTLFPCLHSAQKLLFPPPRFMNFCTGTSVFAFQSLLKKTLPWAFKAALCTPRRIKFSSGDNSQTQRLRRQHNSSAAASTCSHGRKNSPPVPDHKIVSHLIHQRFEKGNANIHGVHNSNSIFRVRRRLSSIKVYDSVPPRFLPLLRLPVKRSLKALISFLSPSWYGAYDPDPVASTPSPPGDPPGQQPRAWTSWEQHKLRIQDLGQHIPACFHYFMVSSSLQDPPTESHRQIHVPPHRHK